MEMTLVKSLSSGDPDMIHTRGLHIFRVDHLQVLFVYKQLKAYNLVV